VETQEKPIKNSELWKSIKTILRLNYNYYFLDAYISPKKVEWYLAVQFRNDPSKAWHPRIVVYIPQRGRVGIFTSLSDIEPTWVTTEIIMTMATSKVTDPNPNFPNSTV
jgi:hypothetical protein